MLISHSENNSLGSSPFRTWKDRNFVQFIRGKARNADTFLKEQPYHLYLFVPIFYQTKI